MNGFESNVFIVMQLLVACAVVLCGAEAVLTDIQAKRLIRKRISDQNPRR